MHSGEASFSLGGTVAAGCRSGGQRLRDRGCVARRPRSCRSRAMPPSLSRDPARRNPLSRKGAPRCQRHRRPVLATLCYTAMPRSGPNPSTSAAPAKEPVMTLSPNSSLDLNYGADRSRRAVERRRRRAGAGVATGEAEGHRCPGICQRRRPRPGVQLAGVAWAGGPRGEADVDLG